MRARLIVIGHIRAEHTAQVALAKNNDMVQAFAAKCANQSFGDAIIRYVSGGASDVLLILVDRRMVRPSGTWGTGST